MNEYQDQVSWVRLETRAEDSRDGMARTFVGDFDSMAEAEDYALHHLPEGSSCWFRRMSGLPE